MFELEGSTMLDWDAPYTFLQSIYALAVLVKFRVPLMTWRKARDAGENMVSIHMVVKTYICSVRMLNLTCYGTGCRLCNWTTSCDRLPSSLLAIHCCPVSNQTRGELSG